MDDGDPSMKKHGMFYLTFGVWDVDIQCHLNITYMKKYWQIFREIRYVQQWISKGSYEDDDCM